MRRRGADNLQLAAPGRWKLQHSTDRASATCIDHTLILGRAQAWKLTSAGFRIPSISTSTHCRFQEKEMAADGTETRGAAITDGQYAGMAGTWKDTL